MGKTDVGGAELNTELSINWETKGYWLKIQGLTHPEIKEKIGHTPALIVKKNPELKVVKHRGAKPTDWEWHAKINGYKNGEEFLKTEYLKMGAHAMDQKFGISHTAITNQLRRIGVKIRQRGGYNR